MLPLILAPHPPLQTVLLKEQQLQYNKENLLNPFFVVFGQRKPEATEAEEGETPWAALSKMVSSTVSSVSAASAAGAAKP